MSELNSSEGSINCPIHPDTPINKRRMGKDKWMVWCGKCSELEQTGK